MFTNLRLIKKTIFDLDNYNLNKYLIIVTCVTAILSIGLAYSIYYLFFEFLFEKNNYQSQYSLINKIYNSYLFYLIAIFFKILLGFTIFGLAMVPVGAIVTGFMSLFKEDSGKWKAFVGLGLTLGIILLSIFSAVLEEL